MNVVTTILRPNVLAGREDRSSLDRGVHMQRELTWIFINESIALGMIQFRSDGGLTVGRTVFEKTCKLVDCRVGEELRLDFADALAIITAPDVIHYLHHVEGKGWHYSNEPNPSGTMLGRLRRAFGIESFTWFLVGTAWLALWTTWCVWH